MPMTPYMRNQGDPPIVPATAAAARRTPVTIETITRRRGLTSPPGRTQRISMNPAAMTTTTMPMVAAMTVPDMPALLPRRAVDEGGPGGTHTGQARRNTHHTHRKHRWGGVPTAVPGGTSTGIDAKRPAVLPPRRSHPPAHCQVLHAWWLAA